MIGSSEVGYTIPATEHSSSGIRGRFPHLSIQEPDNIFLSLPPKAGRFLLVLPDALQNLWGSPKASRFLLVLQNRFPSF